MKKIINLIMALCIMLSSLVSTGCTVRYHGISFQNNESMIREAYIRNAGSQSWVKAISVSGNSIAHIDKSTFSRRVDFKAIDDRGIVYSASNVDISRFGDQIRHTSLHGDEQGYLIFGYLILLPLAIAVDIGAYMDEKKQRDAWAVRNE
jgi:hypothetical protein